ncbi:MULTISPECIES: hypothetical protein [Bacteria]|uniref:hypothetical protein n=1 Tax=Bacteria TaxID=2 RepID=UPI0006585371|nr:MULTISPECIES: hypothetical protein [Bacteria]ELS5458887.1 hypothetical protein [Raoultella ornithinolytica]EME8857496.1 hypothetical protein [Klebsiella aerogenes]QLU28091.1 hypothetical protein HV192_30220 [Klebsiella oxytoca]KMI89732.1 hypothetical protein SN01_05425 [Klebsiella pneumoniae]MCI7901751.1 hypothetical protein [Klebsiella pneumoniae]
MTDITRLINDLNHRMHSAKNLGFDFLFLKLDDLDVIAGALETLQRANTAQGDHIEQLQGTIHQLESRTVKLPESYSCELGYNSPDPNGEMLDRDDVIAVLTANGIKVEAE